MRTNPAQLGHLVLKLELIAMMNGLRYPVGGLKRVCERHGGQGNFRYLKRKTCRNAKRKTGFPPESTGPARPGPLPDGDRSAASGTRSNAACRKRTSLNDKDGRTG